MIKYFLVVYQLNHFFDEFGSDKKKSKIIIKIELNDQFVIDS